MNKYNSLFGKGGLTLDRLRNFVLVADAGGISLAAAGDPTRMSLFSKQIKELESFFGTALTQRQGRAVKLTEAGNRLAQLVRLYLGGLEDFQVTCQGIPQTLTLATGNSMIEWLVMPKLAKLRESLPNVNIEFNIGRTEYLVRKITDMTADVALVREDAVGRPLKCKRLLLVTYSLFLPADWAKGISSANLKSALSSLPLATPISGQFREVLSTSAQKAGSPLRIELTCSSFTQAARAVAMGLYGAVLPSIAASELSRENVVEFPLPFLKTYARPIVAAWNPRLAEVRPLVAQAVNFFATAWAGPGRAGQQ